MGRCRHCNLPLPKDAIITQTIGDSRHEFCCHGCAGAFRIIHEAGLDAFYEKRNWAEDGTPEAVFESRYDPGSLQRFVTSVDGKTSIAFQVDGIRCASCIWLIEKVLTRTHGVTGCRLNYATHRLRVEFDPIRIDPAAIAARLASIGYRPRPTQAGAAENAASRERRDLLLRFGTATFFSMQLMGFSIALYAGYFQDMTLGDQRLMAWFAALAATPVVFYSGAPFLRGAWLGIKNRAPGMDLLIGIGVLATYGYSLHATLTDRGVYFDSAAMIITLILLGRLLESSAREKASRFLNLLATLAPETALVFDGDTPLPREVEGLVPGDRILIRPGERVPVDSLLVEGESEFDESLLSGEPFPVHKISGMALPAGSLNLLGAVTARVLRPRQDSFLARMARFVEEAQSRKAPVQRLADRVAAIFVPVVLGIAALTWAGWMLIAGQADAAILNTAAVLVVACPCALGLATPMAVLVSSGTAASQAILFRGGDIMEATARVTDALFDKTGTLTRGRPRVQAVLAAGSETALLSTAASLEAGSAHPLALAILEHAREQGVAHDPLPAQAAPGRGLLARKNGVLLLAGTRSLLAEHGIVTPPLPPSHLSEIHVAAGGTYQGCILLDDPPRPEALALMDDLRGMGITPAILTGDHAGAAAAVAGPLGIAFQASLAPEQKLAAVLDRQQSGRTVLMTGDGINDGPALSAAEVGCTLAGGTDLALEAADLIISRPDLARIGLALRLARATMRIIRQNLFWAFFYNLCALPLAAAGRLHPIHAAAAMALSSLMVVGNSLRLARVPQGIAPGSSGDSQIRTQGNGEDRPEGSWGERTPDPTASLKTQSDDH